MPACETAYYTNVPLAMLCLSHAQAAGAPRRMFHAHHAAALTPEGGIPWDRSQGCATGLIGPYRTQHPVTRAEKNLYTYMY